MALPRSGDEVGVSVVQIDDENLLRNSVDYRRPAELTAIGESNTPGVIVINRDGDICEPDAATNVLRPTSTKLVIQGSTDAQEQARQQRSRLIECLASAPQYFVGKDVFRRWHQNGLLVMMRCSM